MEQFIVGSLQQKPLLSIFDNNTEEWGAKVVYNGEAYNGEA